MELLIIHTASTTAAPTTTTTTTTTTHQPTTISPTFCTSAGVGNHADPSRCDTYIACDSRRGIRMPCPAGLYYNAKDDICDFPSNVQCNTQGTLQMSARQQQLTIIIIIGYNIIRCKISYRITVWESTGTSTLLSNKYWKLPRVFLEANMIIEIFLTEVYLKFFYNIFS